MPTRSSQKKRVDSKKKRGELKKNRQLKIDFYAASFEDWFGNSEMISPFGVSYTLSTISPSLMITLVFIDPEGNVLIAGTTASFKFGNWSKFLKSLIFFLATINEWVEVILFF